MGANKWKQIAELEVTSLETLVNVVQMVLHLHEDVKAIREHLGIGRAECNDEEPPSTRPL